MLERAGAPLPEADYATLPWGNRVVARLNSTGSRGMLRVRAGLTRKPA